MELCPNDFKASLQSRQRVFGTWLMMDNPVTAEALSFSGLDFLVIDMEHSATDVRQARAQLQAIAGGGASAVVRLPSSDRVVAKKVLDLGAQSLMFPMIQSAQDEQRAVAATRYSPEGVRGVAVMHRANRYKTVDAYLENAARDLCVTVQIETTEAVANAAEIAAVSGVDGLFVGPGDLSASVGLIGQVTHPRVLDNVQRVLELAHAAGKSAGVLAADEDIAQRYAALGFNFIGLGSDLAFMMRTARGAVARMRSTR